MTFYVRPLCVAALLLAAACDETPPTTSFPESLDAQLRRSIGPWGVTPIGASPQQDPALVALGRALMFDKVLSGNRDIACATCHEPALAATDGLPLAIGTGGTGTGTARTLGPGRSFVPRNAPSLLNTAIGLSYVFWDGRLSRFGPPPPEVTLPPDLPNVITAQAMMPVLNRREMRGDAGDVDVLGNPNELAQISDSQPAQVWQAVMQRLLAIPEYVTLFHAAYPGLPQNSLTFSHAARAIAAFQTAALMKTDSRFDHYLRHEDNALSIEEKRGALLFFTRARCASCHNGPFLGGQSFSNSGAPQLGPGVGRGAPLDLGRGELQNNQFYEFAFRVPPLRNVELTAPYFHDGTLPTLETVVAHYSDVPKSLREFNPATLPAAVQSSYHGDRATIDTILATLDFQLRTPLQLTETEQRELVAFLKSLTDPAARDLSGLVPASVPSGLPVR
ncbi:MAG: cytochrome-c peroxidase [Gemmatimonadetes bacterium]|nr:MAG: cytochrome-c peroxidase [Gemmatimonadota bacterium]